MDNYIKKEVNTDSDDIKLYSETDISFGNDLYKPTKENKQTLMEANVKKESNDEDSDSGSSIEDTVLKQRKPKKSTTFDPVVYCKRPICEDRLMSNIKLREIAAVLTKNTPTNVSSASAKFCVEDSLSPTDIEIYVEGIGKLDFPILHTTIQKLEEVSSKAKFGLGEETIIDENVRNTHMIESSKLAVKVNEESFSRILKQMKSSLGLPPNRKLKAELHNLLIYGPGQFFDRHRDSEKIPNMVATLVIILPSPHIGGSLVVEHDNKRFKFSTENIAETNARCACFYSDCWHSIKKVKEGHRIVLTYNVALDDGKLDFTLVDEDFEDAVRSYFEDENDEENSMKLIFLLNHSYSQHSLKWALLKGEDQQVAVKFLAVAKKLDLTINLSLVEISQTMSCGDDDCHYIDEMELIESNHTLVYFVDENGAALPYKQYEADPSQICFTKETFYKNFKPTSKDIQGPTGNEGCTSDYSYKRAAIVLWQKKYSEKTNFQMNFKNALTDLHELVRSPGNEAEVRRIVNLTKMYIQSEGNDSLFQKYVEIALYVKSNEVAKDVLLGAPSSNITVANIPQLLALQNQYGTEFCKKLLKDWITWSSSVPVVMPFTTEFLKAGGNKALAESIIESAIKMITDYWSSRYNNHIDILKACDEIGNKKFQENYAKYLISKCRISLTDLADIFLDLQKTVPENSDRFDPFKIVLIESVKPFIKKTKSQGFWYMDKTSYCNCDICKPVNDFLKSNKQSLNIKGGIMKCKHIRNRFDTTKMNVNLEGSGKNGVITINKAKDIYIASEKEFKKLTELIQDLEGGSTMLKREAEETGGPSETNKKKK